MPRGKPKKGQFAFKAWLPTGGSIATNTTQDHTTSDWIAAMRQQLAQFTKIVDNVEADQKSPEAAA